MTSPLTVLNGERKIPLGLSRIISLIFPLNTGKTIRRRQPKIKELLEFIKSAKTKSKKRETKGRERAKTMAHIFFKRKGKGYLPLIYTQEIILKKYIPNK